MDPMTAGMIGASAISAAGSVGGGMWSASASKDAVKRQIKAQLYMSNTAYQRSVKDLRAAGLNPILALGSPASTPGVGVSQVPDMSGALGSVMSSAAELLQLKSQKLDLQAKQGMYKFLEDNPKMLHLFNAGLMSSTAGLPGMFPLALASIASAKDVPDKAKMWIDKKVDQWRSRLPQHFQTPAYGGSFDQSASPDDLLKQLFKDQK